MKDDVISRQAAIDELKKISFSHWFECGEYLSEDTREIEIINSSKALEVIEALPSVQPEQTRIFVELVVEYPDPELCTYKEYRGKPYYSIKYIENGETYVGYGTYKPKVLSQYLKENFISSAQPDRSCIDQIKWERDTAIQQLNELGYSFGEAIRHDKDAISRKGAINAVCTVLYPDADKMNDAKEVLKEMPLAQPEYYDYSDIEPLWKSFAEENDINLTDTAKQLKDAMWCGYRKGKADAQPEPSQVARDIADIIENEKDMRVIARSEIIRCKDCKHSRFFDPCFYCYELGGEIIVPENGFCFMAERRTDGQTC